jgi:hypothetical protein
LHFLTTSSVVTILPVRFRIFSVHHSFCTSLFDDHFVDPLSHSQQLRRVVFAGLIGQAGPLTTPDKSPEPFAGEPAAVFLSTRGSRHGSLISEAEVASGQAAERAAILPQTTFL